MIKVTSGKYRGRGVESPPRSKEIRPTTSLIRESIFNKFQYKIPGCRFLDLFAGSGIMGLEALSRGASFVLAVEGDEVQCRAIRRDYATIGIAETEAKIITYDVKRLLTNPCREEAFDMVFMDPPYGYRNLPKLVEACLQNGWLKPNGIFVVEHGNRDPDLPDFIRKNYGDTSISIRQLIEEADPRL
jgi:16S rRNA (guanine966-N2)-methyltransferase